MISITSFMFQRLQKLNMLDGSICVRESTFKHEYEGKQEIGEEILFDYETGAAALVKMSIRAVEKQKKIIARNSSDNKERQIGVLPYVISVHFNLIKVINKGGDISTLFIQEEQFSPVGFSKTK